MQPSCVPGCFLGTTPLLEHVGCNAAQFVDLFLCLRVGYKFESMTIGIKKVDRLKDTVIDGADDVNALGVDPVPGGEQRIVIVNFERDVLYPCWRVVVTPRRSR